MQAVDFEVERQQADEELTRLLGELVVKPLDSQLGERIQSGLFCFGEELDANLKRQLAPLGKSRDLERNFEDLGENLEAVERRLQQQSATLNEQLQSGLGEQLKQQELALREQLAGIEHAEAGRAAQLQAVVEALAEQLAEARQSLLADSRQLQCNLSEQLKQQGFSLHEQLASQQEQGTQILGAEFKQQASAQQEQLQHSHAELSAMLGSLQHLPDVLADLQGQATDARRQFLGLVQQQQTLLELQQRETQQLRRSISRLAWTGLVLGGLGCAGLTILALYTPTIRALLGLAA